MFNFSPFKTFLKVGEKGNDRVYISGERKTVSNENNKTEKRHSPLVDLGKRPM